MFGLFGRKKEPGEVWNKSQLEALFIDRFAPNHVLLDDTEYMLLPEEQLHNLSVVHGQVDAKWAREFADCDDFVRWSLAQMTRKLYRDGHKKPGALFFANVRLTGQGENHALVAMVSKGGRVSFFDPQNKKWYRTDEEIKKNIAEVEGIRQ